MRLHQRAAFGVDLAVDAQLSEAIPERGKLLPHGLVIDVSYQAGLDRSLNGLHDRCRRKHNRGLPWRQTCVAQRRQPIPDNRHLLVARGRKSSRKPLDPRRSGRTIAQTETKSGHAGSCARLQQLPTGCISRDGSLLLRRPTPCSARTFGQSRLVCQGGPESPHTRRPDGKPAEPAPPVAAILGTNLPADGSGTAREAGDFEGSLKISVPCHACATRAQTDISSIITSTQRGNNANGEETE